MVNDSWYSNDTDYVKAKLETSDDGLLAHLANLGGFASCK